MDTYRALSRRAVLVAGAASAGVAGAAVLAACSSSSADQKAAGAGSEQDSSSVGSSAPSTAASGAGGSASSAGGADALATLADIPVGTAVAVKLPGGKPGVVSRPTSSTAACFSAICTHAGCTVTPAGAKLDCPCHGSQFNAVTGAVLQGPASSPLAKVQVRVEDGKVVAV